MELFFDTETTGTPNNQLPTHPSQPDIIQLAAILSTEDTIFAQLCCVIDPSDLNPEWKMNPFAEAAHGMSVEFVKQHGLKHTNVLNLFFDLLERADLVVCHNTAFDIRLMELALHKAAFPYEEVICLNNKPQYCTMKRSTSMCGLRNKNGAPKWPKLNELYPILFEGEPFENQHDALADVQATRRCFYELQRRGI